jgi:hypothetical protein
MRSPKVPIEAQLFVLVGIPNTLGFNHTHKNERIIGISE